MNRTAILRRNKFIPESDTFGEWMSDSGWSCRTAELPWRNNAKDISCIPDGTYTCSWLWSNKHQANLYHAMNVPGRGNVEIHASNIPSLQLLGCISPGETVSTFIKGSVISSELPPLDKNYLGVTASVTMLALLEKDMRDDKGNQQDFSLKIING